MLSTILRRVRGVRPSSRTVPWALLVLMVLGYGLLIPGLGYYWDDWPYTWFSHVLGPLGFVKAFAHDRPFLSLVYMLTAPLAQMPPAAWQGFGILMRLLMALALWWTLRLLWPRAPRLATASVFLFAIFPGFGQQWISVIYSRAYIILAGFLASLGCMLWALRGSKRAYLTRTLLGLAGAAFSLFSTEYFFGLELLRPVLLWITFREQRETARKAAWKALLHWLPYLLLWLGYGIYHFLELNSQAYKGYAAPVFEDAMRNPQATLLQALADFGDALIKGGITGWTHSVNLLAAPSSSAILALSIGVALLVFGLGWVYFSRPQQSPQAALAENGSLRFAWQAIGLGVAAILLGRFPSWAAGLPLRFEFPWDRFMLSMMLGSGLLLAGLLELLSRWPRVQLALFCLVLGLSAGGQVKAADSYQQAWNAQREFFWQLSWRMPGIEPGTLLLAVDLPLQYYSDYSLSAPLNWIYAPELSSSSDKMPYLLLYTRARLKGTLPSLEPNQQIDFNYRALNFSGTTSQVVGLYLPQPGCLMVLDNRPSSAATLLPLSKEYEALAHITELTPILPDAAPPTTQLVRLLGPEPAHNWCYYFEKAQLAQQVEDWHAVTQLYQQAQADGLHSNLAVENVVFVDGFARQRMFAPALALSQQMLADDPSLKVGLCTYWKRTERSMGADVEMDQIRVQLGCDTLK